MKTLILAAFACLALTSCFETFQQSGDEIDSMGSFIGSGEAVVGERNVAGVEFPTIVTPMNVGFGAWLHRPKKPTDAELEAQERALIQEILDQK